MPAYPYSFRDKLEYWVLRGGMPITKLIIAANVITFFIFAFWMPEVLKQFLIFNTKSISGYPWTVFTYPLAGYMSPFSLLFACYWLWIAGGSLERSWSSRTFGIFFFVISAITALGIYLASLIIGAPQILVGLWLPLAAVTIAFAMLNPEQIILFFFVIPMKLKYLALIDVIFVVLSYIRISPLLAVFALAGCAVSYWYTTRNRLSFNPIRRQPNGQVIRIYPMRRMFNIFNRLNLFRLYREYRDRKRLRKLFEKSGYQNHNH